MSSLIFSDLQDQLDNGFFNPFNLSNLPGGDWVAALPCKIVLQVIDQLHLVQDRNTIRSLALTCRKLNAYCMYSSHSGSSALKTLELNTAMAPGFEVMGLILPDGEEISGVLSWLAASVRAQTSQRGPDMITITLSMEKDLKLSQLPSFASIGMFGQVFESFRFQRRWPELQTIPIFGGSVVTAGETVVIAVSGVGIPSGEEKATISSIVRFERHVHP
ncbi:hypothetical protein BKA70DRAFT_1536232 [Coprinopsis sp. MPI-PUGE-AT-0042]|nr:hypothetical protein BKA70DRAFT_1536232 [Coprinopsis sp. MPI-PUGE-AT-0042]